MPTLLTFNLAPQKRAALQVIALRGGIKLQAVPGSRTGATLAQLLSGDPGQTTEPRPFTEELLVFDGFGERMLDAVLTELRRRRVHVALKAVVTPTNAQWTAAELYDELCQERAAVAEGRQAHEEHEE